MWLLYLKVFLVGGFICFLGQILIIKTNMTSSRILVLFVCIGAVMEAFRKNDSPIFNDLLPHIPYPQVKAALNRLSLMLPFGSH